MCMRVFCEERAQWVSSAPSLLSLLLELSLKVNLWQDFMVSGKLLQIEARHPEERVCDTFARSNQFSQTRLYIPSHGYGNIKSGSGDCRLLNDAESLSAMIYRRLIQYDRFR